MSFIKLIHNNIYRNCKDPFFLPQWVIIHPPKELKMTIYPSHILTSVIKHEICKSKISTFLCIKYKREIISDNESIPRKV